MTAKASPTIRITYCTQCGWLLRAGWMAQELLSTFGTELGEVVLVPGTGGVFEVTVDGTTVWERKRDGGFPDAAEESPITSSAISGPAPSMRWRTGPDAGSMRAVRRRTPSPCQT